MLELNGLGWWSAWADVGGGVPDCNSTIIKSSYVSMHWCARLFKRVVRGRGEIKIYHRLVFQVFVPLEGLFLLSTTSMPTPGLPILTV